jgi:class 3 adenylate cyclase/tetratricopeptide (TPR) repeat protein
MLKQRSGSRKRAVASRQRRSAMPGTGEKAYYFEGFTLDLRRGALRRAEREIELRPKSVDVLRYLVENAGRLVSRDELLKAVWPNVLVTDESVTRCVSDIRQALGDDDQRIVKTLQRRGYEFVAPLSAVAIGASGTDRARHGGRSTERRQLTIMSCELAGLAALSARRDPEDLRAVAAECHLRCTSLIERHDGYVARYHGDHMLAYFGYPEAHEHDAEQSVRAALALVEAIAALATTHAAPLALRVGIATGLVVVGDIGREGAAQQDVVGEAPHVAVRLQALAPPGQVVISDETRRLAGAFFDYGDLGRVQLPGLTDPAKVWQVGSASAVDNRFEAQRGPALSPLVGRAEEVELLLRRWHQAGTGTGRLVVVSGEAGIGKSRLTAEVAARIQSDQHTLLQYFCSPHRIESPFHPVAAQLERAIGIQRQDGPDARLGKLAAMFGASKGQGDDLHLLTDLMSIPANGLLASLDWTPQRKKKETLEALLRDFERASRHRPMLAVFEDVHWIDPSSQELLDMMVERVARLPVLLIVTCRPEFRPPWIGAAHVSLLALGRLAPGESALLAAQVASDRTLPPDVVSEIVTRGDGVPLFLEELTKAVLENGSASGAQAKPTSVARAIPVTLQSSLMARLDRLGGMVNEVAEIGAAIGREFSYELLAPIVQGSDEVLRSALEKLCAAGLVHCRGTPPQASYLFKHALVRDAAYGRLLSGRRQSVHAGIAATLEERFPDIVQQEPELLALHWGEAASIKKAVEYRVRAARLARERYALAESIAQANRGLALLPALDDGPERWRLELQLRANLGWALFHSKGEGAADAGAAFSRARLLCDLLGERSLLGVILFAEASHLIACASFVSARHLGEELSQVAGECNDVGLQFAAHEVMGRSFFYHGAYAPAAAHLERVLNDPAPGAHDHYGLAGRCRTNCLSHLALALQRLGYLDQGVSRRNQALEAARQGAHPYALAVVLSLSYLHDGGRGTLQAASACIRELAAITQEQGYAYFHAVLDLLRGVELSLQGETQNGLALARRACDAPAYLTKTEGHTGRLFALARCCERAGRVDEALGLLDESLRSMTAAGDLCFDAEVHRLKGEWLIAHSPHRRREAEECFRRALAVAREQQARLWELRAAVGLARLWRDDGKREDARDLLAPIYGWFTEGFGEPDLQEAKALLDQL